MPFRFPLEAVLHFRKSVEHQQELRLRTANQLVARARHLVEQIDRCIQDLQARQAQQLNAGTTSAELQFARLGEAALRQQRHAVQSELARFEKLRDEQQKIFQLARRERETIGSLRDRQLRDYQRDTLRKEQRALVDLVLLRQSYLAGQDKKRHG